MKKLNSIVLIIMLLFTSTLVFAEENKTETKDKKNDAKIEEKDEQEVGMKEYALLRINGKYVRRVPEKGYPFISNKTVVYVPVKLVCEELGYTVKFDCDQREQTSSDCDRRTQSALDEATQSVNINDSANLKIGSSKSGNIDLGGKVVVINGILYSPVSLLNEVLGLDVEFKNVYNMSLIEVKGEKLSDKTETENKEEQGSEDKKNDKTELTDKEKKEGVVAHDTKYTGVEYENSEGRVGFVLGSNKNNKKTDRPKDATFEQDREYFNYLTGSSDQKINIDGSLTYKALMNKHVSNDQVGFKISRTKNGEPQIHAWDWAVKDTTYSKRILHMNLAMEGFKYYAKSDEDGKAIWAYLNNAFKTGTEICDGKTIHKFGKTKVIFSDPKRFGADITFIND